MEERKDDDVVVGPCQGTGGQREVDELLGRRGRGVQSICVDGLFVLWAYRKQRCGWRGGQQREREGERVEGGWHVVVVVVVVSVGRVLPKKCLTYLMQLTLRCIIEAQRSVSSYFRKLNSNGGNQIQSSTRD